jgi:hypothetical protein
MFKDELQEYVQTSNLVNMKECGDGIYVLKYKKKVFYDNLWNDYIAECRGSIVDKDFNLVTYPFTKIYNYGIEKEAPVLADDTKVTAFRKVNGFMAAITWHNNALLVSTTGSTDSPYVAMVEEFVNKNRDAFETHCEFYKDFTWMFECVHRDDPHIIPEKEGLYLLGWRKKEWGSQVECDPFALGTHAQVLGTNHVESTTTNMARLKQMAKECRHEGYVFYTDDGVSSKIKSPYYLTSKWVARNPRTDKLVDLNKDIKHNLDEEYYLLVDAIRENIVEYTAMDEQARLAWVRNFMESA